MRGRINGWSVNKGRRVCGGGRANQVSTAFGKTQGCVVLVPWFVGCLVGYQCKASIDSIWGKRLVAWFVCCWWATHPFFFTLLPLVGWFGHVVAWLVGRLVGTPLMDGCMDGWMDGSCAASRSGGVRVSFRRFPSFRTVSAQFPEGSEGLVTRSY